MTRMHVPSPGESRLSPKRAVQRVDAFRAKVRSRPGGALIWCIGVTIVGVLVVVVGIVLLPLPGPGWLIIFAGLGLLATEYEWARRLLRFARGEVQRWTDWARRQPRWSQAVIGVVGFVFLVAVFGGVYLVLYR